ncbi:MAG TPA: RNA 2',3'-cyclic phosphodiesterase [Syntrophorhabdaceae bacterium]|nr:RNA 2',3'-cyclic phosphodiesterase [Syntrophorhabdaceae bacterium]
MRTFLALELPQGVKTHLTATIDSLTRRISGVRWVKPNALHITLKFFGEIDETKMKEIQLVLDGINDYYTAMPVRLKELDAFPNRKRPKVLVATLYEEVDNIKTIFHDIENRLEAAGIEKEKREFIPHITLGRLREPAPVLKQHMAPLDETIFYIDNLVLYRSTLTREGAVHDPLSEIRFVKKDEK